MANFLIGVSFLLLFLVNGVRIVWSWGTTGHTTINRNVVRNLPPAMQMFIDQADFLANHASDADLREPWNPREGPKHFLDLDSYPESPTIMSWKSLDSLQTVYGDAAVTANGLLPWAIEWTMDSLTAQMKRGDWSRALLSAADLGHYVADAHQPFHATKNSDPDGLHSRYESTLIDHKFYLITTSLDTVTYIFSPVDYMFEFLTYSHSLLAPIISADSLARVASEGSTTSDEYYDTLWAHTGNFTKALFQSATTAFANLLYSAWVNAGSPQNPSNYGLEQKEEDIPKEFLLEQNYPNPFNPTTLITYHLPVAGHVNLKVLNVLGHEVTTLVDRDQSTGTHHVSFDGTGLPSGMYFYQLRFDRFLETKRMALIK